MFYKGVLAVFLIVLGLSSCKKQEIVVFEKPYSGPMMTAYNIETLYSDSGKVKVRLRAPVQFEYANGDRRFPNGIHIEFFKKNGEINSVLTANKGYYFKQTDNYKVTGNVVIENNVENKKLNSEELLWEPQLKRVSTDKFVRIQTPTEILTGIGMTASQDFKFYKILKPTGVFAVK
ncbi:MAG: LPS export ABC transporter periplasmic protein LptC [Cytophagales bacterium]|nr:LPS export ABC transporter periplasmic protein LptC [Cytophagales bacterium]